MARKKKQSFNCRISSPKLQLSSQIATHLAKFHSFLEINLSCHEYKYKIGDFYVSLSPSVFNNKPFNTDTLFMHFKKYSSECFVCWEELKQIEEERTEYRLNDHNQYENCTVQKPNLNFQDQVEINQSMEAIQENMLQKNEIKFTCNTNRDEMKCLEEQNVEETAIESGNVIEQKMEYEDNFHHERIVEQNYQKYKESKQVVFFYGVCNKPYKLLDSLSTKSQFHLILDSKYDVPGCLHINIFINLGSIRTLSYAAQPQRNRFQAKVQTVIEHFYGIVINDYENDFIDEEKHVESIYRCITNYYNPQRDVKISHPVLIPQLRAYQSQAVNWMLECETESRNELQSDIHILYVELDLSDDTKIFYHKYNGFFVEHKFTPLPLFKGGILADEMGLGKTIEVLALILLHPRKDVLEYKLNIDNGTSMDLNIDDQVLEPVLSFVEDQIKRKRKKINYSSSEESLIIFNEDSDQQTYSSSEANFQSTNKSIKNMPQISFECICGHAYKNDRLSTVKCKKCCLIQHARCVLADVTDISDIYICPYCWVDSSVESVQSRSTLIVSPSAILHQWEHEIDKHVKCNNLNVFMYLGVEHHKFINPVQLADNDIVLTSYEIFRREFIHVNVPHGKNQRSLRNPKKFRTIPSPLSAVEWWRICLDEAQMIEGVSSNVAKMALELNCVNRWCVTGTPIQKSVEDLYGLLLFLGCDPYQEKEWWKKLLCKPFANGMTDNLIAILNKVLWRTDKVAVLDQMNIPEQETILNKLELSKVERVFYESMLSRCRSEFLEKVRKYACEDSKLKAIDKLVLSKIMLPLKKLEQACCHFQLAGDKFANVERCKMTIPELLNHLLKRASYECEEMHRKLILALNGLAGTFAIKEDYKNACDMYKKVLFSVEENKETVRTDSLQQIHALHNYSEILKIWVSSAEDMTLIQQTIQCDNVNTFCEEIESKCSEFCKIYLIKFEAVTESCKNSLSKVHTEISTIKSEFIYNNKGWWISIFDDMDEEERYSFSGKIKDYLLSAPGKDFIHGAISMSDSFHDINGLKYCLIKGEDDLQSAHDSLVEAIENLLSTPTQPIVNKAIECHLRPTSGQRVSKCVYCKANDLFNRYESKLFRFKESTDSDEVSDEEEICFGETRKGTHADSEFELALKFVLNYCRNKKDFLKYIDDGNNECKLFDALKKEFKILRNAWIKMCEYVAAIDELEMAKTSMRLLLPGEEVPNPPLPHIIVPHELEGNMLQLESDASCHKYEFKKRLGQLFYLQNLKKAENVDGPFEESCPVCCQAFEGSWCVLQCGHNFCLPCIQTLKQKLGARCNSIRCPICRENTESADIYYLESRSNALEDVPIKGSHSTKISAIVKCLLNIQKKDSEAKTLVFSSWKNLLLILEHALNENEIKYMSLTDKKCKTFQTALDVFKTDATCKVLLLPLKVGANGLNLVEATHVLLAEPLLDHSKILQAIGRVHRIGQRKKTFVHKFVVKNSIEENIFEIHKNELLPIEDTNEAINLSLSVNDLKNLFVH